jgi:hypothetical protein
LSLRKLPFCAPHNTAVTATVRPLGEVTRGTTAARRLRRVDRWLLAARSDLASIARLLVVDLGFGASPVTTVELHRRLREINLTARVVGLDIDRDRVLSAQEATTPGLSFAVGGFELAGERPHVVRAFNVLRQYDEADVQPAWERIVSMLQPGGWLVDGTCDEVGRLGAWVVVTALGPQSLTLAVDPDGIPSEVAARLPKALIHHNVPGEAIHRLLHELDDAWKRTATLAPYGPRQRLAAAVESLREAGWPLLDGPSRWRRGELTVAWRAVSPPLHR